MTMAKPSLTVAPFANRTSNPPTSPNTMNDNVNEGMKEPDTCRICRGEGDALQSLFHPCKCSGSIKYVHQECLMEWLSHSQKKHCELCKTAFRFTKLYAPNMPQSLPFHVLLRHFVIHAAKNMATWLRFCLVFIVWLGLLPYTIRQVWRFLFWFSDGAWPNNNLTGSDNITRAINMAHEAGVTTGMTNGTTPVLPFGANPTSPASRGTIVDKLVELLMPVTHALNISGSDDIATSLFKSIYYGLRFRSILSLEPKDSTNSVSDTLSGISSAPESPSLLSDIKFLQNLTKNTSFNRLIINIAEGHIITLLVLICFILIFLIREWVVQQQPGINMGAAFNAEFAGPERPRNIIPQPLAIEADMEAGAGNLPEPSSLLPEQDAIQNENTGVSHEAQNCESGDSGKLMSVLRERNLETDADQQRMADYFLEIWNRADGNFEEVMSVIGADGKTDDLKFWINAMKDPENQTITGRQTQSTSTSDLNSPQTWEMNPKFQSHDSTGKSKHSTRASDSSASNTSSWIDAPEINENEDESSSMSKNSLQDTVTPGIFQEKEIFKGKSHAQSTGEIPQIQKKFSRLERSESSSTPNYGPISPLPVTQEKASQAELGSRPRSVSDSPQLKGPSPLSTNSWSFPKLQSDIEGDVIYAMALKAAYKNSGLTNGAMASSENNYDLKGYINSESYKLAASRAHRYLSSQNDDEIESETFELERKANLLDSDSAEGLKKIDSSASSIDPNKNIEDLAENLTPSNDLGAESPAEVNVQFNRPQPENPSPETRNLNVARPAPPNFFGKVADFFWGGVGEDRNFEILRTNDNQDLPDLAAEAQIIPAANQNEQREANAQVAAVPGMDLNDVNDADAIEDAEDFEGIMELVGMRGPIFSLVQNALFSSFLLGLTVAIGIWIPYNIGRIALLLVANPVSALKLPLRILFGCAAFMQDLALSIIGFSFLLLIKVMTMLCSLSSSYFSFKEHWIASYAALLTSAATNISSAAFRRIKEDAVNNIVQIADSDMLALSAACHQSLITIQSIFINLLKGLGSSITYLFTGDYHLNLADLPAIFKVFLTRGLLMESIPSWLANQDLWSVSPDLRKTTVPIDLELSVWNGTDRFYAILAGYIVLCILGALYVRKDKPFLTGQVGRELEAAIVDLLNQAGGVVKVILIISIEMLAFPLYCGLLLDIALLPLFENATMLSRIIFTINSPFTSTFVHWFVGTCYMFHFALFVSMCRQIMRKGVLYFIRDPDDPTFHPVRDVLERNVTTQLQKILFSAIVYGGLVIVCLGGVVWGISFTCKDVLPLHWSSNEPVLEFPIDLLFYNFLMPLAVRYFKPSHGIRTLYDWWFRRCARMLRLTWFMFDERRPDEEGRLIHRTWRDFFCGSKSDPNFMVSTDEPKIVFEKHPQWSAYYRRDGRYVRAPASDHVRIPRGSSIFLEVDEMNNRIDGKPDESDGIHGRDSILSKQVYIPPWFRLRIGIFIISIWFFAALTGIGVTIVPLVFGRMIFAEMIPFYVRENDIYAFSVGIYVIGSALYFILHLKDTVASVRNLLAVGADPLEKAIRCISLILTRLARITWTYSAFLLILPTLFTFLVEFYFIIPLHTYLAMGERHVVHFVQSWTLGLLYVKLTTRIILWYENSRPAQSLRAITRDGYLNPDARLATRSFILPCAIVLFVALFSPFVLAQLTIKALLQHNPEKHLLVYRYSYPICLCLCCIALVVWVLIGWIRRWRLKIRDEVYLIGERLHNFGERKMN